VRAAWLVASRKGCISNGDVMIGASVDLSGFSGRLDAVLFARPNRDRAQLPGKSTRRKICVRAYRVIRLESRK